MKKSPLDIAGQVQKDGLIKDNQYLKALGIDPASPEASPHYLGWIRTDLVIVVSLLDTIAEESRSSARYAKWTAFFVGLIAVMLARKLYIG